MIASRPYPSTKLPAFWRDVYLKYHLTQYRLRIYLATQYNVNAGAGNCVKSFKIFEQAIGVWWGLDPNSSIFFQTAFRELAETYQTLSLNGLPAHAVSHLPAAHHRP